MRIILVIPAYNESRTLSEVIENCKKYVSEVIVVDDGSNDDTAYLARRGGATVLCHLVNRGYGAALKTGIVAALKRGAEVVVTIDADGQHNPAEIPKLIQPIVMCRGRKFSAPTIGGECPDIVIGDRFASTSKREGMSLLRKIFITAGNLLTWILYGVRLRDTQSGFRAYTRDVLEQLSTESTGMEFSSEVLGEAWQKGLRIASVPITVRYTQYSLSKGQNLFEGIRTAFRLCMRKMLK